MALLVSRTRMEIFNWRRTILPKVHDDKETETMSIDATIAAVSVIAPDYCTTCDGSGKDDNGWDTCPSCHGATKENPKVRLLLEPRERGGIAGQDTLTIINPPSIEPKILTSLVGIDIWGCSGFVMIGDTRWADRVGYTRIKLINGYA